MKNFVFSLLILILILILLLFNGLAFAHGGDEEPAEESNTATLSRIELSKEQEKILGLRTRVVKLSEVQPAIEANGTIEEIPNLHFQVNSPVKGRVMSINVTLGSHVQKGQTLAIIESQEVTQLSAAGDTDQANYRSQVAQARANLELERKRYEREKSLYEHKINSQKELEAAENSLKNAQSVLKAAEQNLTISVNSTQKRLSQIGGTKSGQVYLKAPLAGQISEINMTLGQTVDLGQTLIHGVNLSEVWISGQVFEKDINKIKLKQKVKAFLTTSKEVYDGKVIFINPLIDPTQRSYAVKAVLNNASGKLKAGQFLQMKVETKGIPEKAILLEKDSLIEKNGEQYVYVRVEQFLVPTKVKISAHKHQDYLEIEDGLKVGDEIVIEGAYLLPSKGKAEEQHHEHEEEHQEKQIPLWIWLTGGGVALLAAFFAGKLNGRKNNE